MDSLDRHSNDTSTDRATFLEKVRQRHGRVNPCFMTGKGCVYTDQIDQRLDERHKSDGASGFMIMPFRPKLKVFFQNCLQPFFEANYGGPALLEPLDGKEPKFSLTRADDVSRPGIIICEGICKRIQESDFVVADISVPNDNVFYELGLAYGIGQKIALIHQRGAKFGQMWARYLRGDVATRADTRVKEYDNLEFIKREDFKVSQYFWKRGENPRQGKSTHPEVLFFEMMKDGQKQPEPPPTGIEDEDISLSFRTHVMSDVGLALNHITNNLKEQQLRRQKSAIPEVYVKEIIGAHLDRAHVVEPSDPFDKTRERMDSCYCLIVRTGRDCHPMAYFWLGYGHARGKNVIPITQLIVDGEHEPSKAPAQRSSGEPIDDPSPSSGALKDMKGKVVDLAFDIRAQRHMTFDPSRPELLEHQLERTLHEMIRADFSEWSRRRLWAQLLGNRGEVSIITGGLHSRDHNREMIGDWDLRAASELTSYFSRHQFRPKIETPIYQPEFAKHFDKEMTTEAYVQQVTKDIRIGDKNCVVIASPDVNPLTEILLGRLNRVADTALFSEGFKPKSNTQAIVVYKGRKVGTADSSGSLESKTPKRAFYQEHVGTQAVEQRGFMSEGFANENTRVLDYFGQDEHSRLTERRHFDIYAQLIVARNPFAPPDRPRFVIILNGVSGPATFALTHVLTGGGNEEFESYQASGFDPAAASESILNKLLLQIDEGGLEGGLGCIETVIKVKVGVNPGSDGAPQKDTRSSATFDWRRILSWELDKEVLGDEFRRR